MLTAFTVEYRKPKNRAAALLSGLRGNTVREEFFGAGSVALRVVHCVARGKRVDFGRILPRLEGCRKVLSVTDFPAETGLQRFENREFPPLLAMNLGLRIVKNLGPNLRVGFFDPTGERSGFLSELAPLCEAVVLTDNLSLYHDIRDEIAFDTGVSVSVSEREDCLLNCPLVIAPDKIEKPLAISGNSVTVTGFEPEFGIRGMCCHDFSVRLPDEYEKIRPKVFTSTYFCGALYSLGHVRGLGSLVPSLCSNRTCAQTPRSLENYLKSALA